MTFHRQYRSQPPILGMNSTIPFGKHSGETVEVVLDEDPGYLRWFIEQVKTYKIDPELHEAIYDRVNVHGPINWTDDVDDFEYFND